MLCLIEGMQNIQSNKSVMKRSRRLLRTLLRRENLALFQGQLVEVFRKFTNIDSSSLEGQSLLGQHFISQSAPDIRRKLQKLQYGP